MFQPSGSSDYDLRFSLLGIPVQVQPMFWLMALILGWRWFEIAGPMALATWVGVVFISILIHELGHALAARSVGHHPAIQLTFFGGVAYFQQFQITPWKLVYIAAAGPAAGIMLFMGCLGLVTYGYVPENVTVEQLIEVNFWWTLFNLVPVYPLDGGQVLLGLTQAIVPRFSAIITHGFGALVAGVLSVLSIRFGLIFSAVFFAMFCVLNIQMLQNRRMY